MNEKTVLKLVAICPLFCVTMFMYIALMSSSTITTEVRGFGIDSKNLLYIGTAERIEVYENGSMVRTINPKTSRGYVFSIQPDDTILLSTSRDVYRMSLEGEVLETWQDSGADTYNQINYKKKSFKSATGEQYRKKSPLLWTRIVNSKGEVIYKISIFSYIMRMAVIFCIILFVMVIGAEAKSHINNMQEDIRKK